MNQRLYKILTKLTHHSSGSPIQIRTKITCITITTNIKFQYSGSYFTNTVKHKYIPVNKAFIKKVPGMQLRSRDLAWYMWGPRFNPQIPQHKTTHTKNSEVHLQHPWANSNDLISKNCCVYMYLYVHTYMSTYLFRVERGRNKKYIF